MNKMETLKQKLIEGLKFHGSDSSWVENANMREVNGQVFIQTEGHDNDFPKGIWEDIKFLIEILEVIE